MISKADAIRLRHIDSHATEILALCAGLDRKALDADRLLSLAVVRLLEIVGEAAARVTPAAQQALPEIPWSQIIGLRNRLIHGYDAVDHDIVWDIIQLDLQPLVIAVRNGLAAPP